MGEGGKEGEEIRCRGERQEIGKAGRRRWSRRRRRTKRRRKERRRDGKVIIV